MNTSPAPNFALLSAVDISSFSGDLFTRSSAIPSQDFTTKTYEDLISFLNGRGMQLAQTLGRQLITLSSFGTSWHIGIDANDKIEISSSHDFKIKFNSGSTLIGNTDVLGIGSSYVNTSGAATIGTPLLAYKVTAPSEWSRGELVSFSYKIEEIGGGGGAFNFNFAGGAQDLIVALRARGSGDIDDSAECLEAEDLAQHPLGDIRWYVNNAGKVVCSYVGASNITWDNSEFKKMLGFTGDEVTQLINNYTVIEATNYAKGVLVPSRPYQDNYLTTENVSQSRRLIGGRYVSNYIGTYIATVLSFDLDARLDQIDLYRHFTDNFISFISEGERINFYQNWGDSRRAMISASADSDQPAHDLVFTSSRNGYEGRVRASLLTSSFNLQYPTRLRRRVPVTIRMEHLNE